MSKVVKHIYDNDGKYTGWKFVEVPEEAPNDDKNYIRKGKQWVEAPTSNVSGDVNLDGGNASSTFTNSILIDGGKNGS